MVLHKVTSDQSNLLRDLSHVAYSLNFGNHWEGEGLALYLKDQFGPARLSSDLSGPEILYFFIRKGTENAGFMKINLNAPMAEFEGQACCELEKMYVLPEFKGQGLGKTALNEIVPSLKKVGISSLVRLLSSVLGDF